MADICIYVQKDYSKKAYKTESYNVRKFFGIEMIRDALTRGGFDVDYASISRVTDFKIVLVSITSPIDWYSFIDERARWPEGKYKVIIGGAGVLNIRPLLDYADIFVFGRGETIISPLVEAVLSGNRFDHESVCYSKDFSPDQDYKVCQVTEPYPFKYYLGNGNEYQESAIGCAKKCLFCAYTWQRKYTGQFGQASGEYNRANVDERTIWDYDLTNPESWLEGVSSRYIIIGVDGLSERLRFQANKQITREMLVDFLAGCSHLSDRLFRVKLFQIIGYPGETDSDWQEYIETIRAGDLAGVPTKRDDRLIIETVATQFKPFPVSPAAVWPARYFDYRGYHEKFIVTPSRYKHKIFDGQGLRLLFMPSIESLATFTLIMLINRGTEQDAGILRQIAINKEFQNANATRKRVTLESVLDIDRLFRAYDWDEIPTRYLSGYIPNEGLAKLSKKYKPVK